MNNIIAGLCIKSSILCLPVALSFAWFKQLHFTEDVLVHDRYQLSCLIFLLLFFLLFLFTASSAVWLSVGEFQGFFVTGTHQTDVHLYLNLHRSCQPWVICRILSIKVIFLLLILHHATVTTPLSVEILEMAGLRLGRHVLFFLIARFICDFQMQHDTPIRSDNVMMHVNIFNIMFFCLFVCIGMNFISNYVVFFIAKCIQKCFSSSCCES